MKYFLIAALASFLIITFHNISYCQPNPVICMPFNGNALDISGNNHHGFVDGSVLTNDRFGNPNSAFDFDGVDDHIQIVDPIMDFIVDDEITIVFWARTEAVANNSPILVVPNSNSDRLNIHIHYDNNGVYSTFWDYGSIFSGGRLNIPNTPFQTAWEHYAFVVSATQDSMIVYKDGVVQGSKVSVSTITDRTRHFNIGGGISDVTNCHFHGQMDDVQFFDVALSANEVYNNYVNSSSCVNNILSYAKGRVYFDVNSNSVQDVNEFGFGNSIISAIGTNRMAYTFNNGDYIFGFDSIGTYEITPNISVPYYQPNPLTHTFSFSSAGEVDSLLDFALQPSGNFNDLRVIITPLTPFRPGFANAYNLHYENVGTTTLGGNLVFYPDTLITYDSSSVTPISVATDSIIWSIAPLQPFENGDITVYSVLQIGTANGTLINSSAKIEPVAGDAFPSDNYSAFEVFSTGSYDPNDISVNISNFDVSQNATPPFLNYVIRFQNTGTDTAFTVIVEDILPVELNYSTFEFISSSHLASVDFDVVNRKLRFIFNNILLPDSNINESASHGYISYRIKPETNLLLGTDIINNAGIFFDFNTAVLTNDAITEVTNLTGIENVASYIFELGPNPTSGIFNVKNSGKNILQVEISDSKGSLCTLLSKEKLQQETVTIDLGTAAKGIYLVKIITDNAVHFQKIIKL
jgi:uncharacterized repeat protein (TIGR01451 family)